MPFPTKSYLQLKQLLVNRRSAVVTVHKNPDGDAMGSGLAWYHILKKWAIDVHIIVPNDYPAFLHFLPGNDDVINFERERDKALPLIEDADVIFALDYNDFSRTGDMADFLVNSPADKVLIDHHLDPVAKVDMMFSNPKSCATAEMVYNMMEGMELLEMLDADIATCIYTGLVTDTGSFRFPSTSDYTHRIAAHLIQLGVNNGAVHRHLSDNNSETMLKMRGHVLSNNLVVLPEYKTAYIWLSRKEQEKYDTKPGDTEGLVNEALSIKGVVMAAFFKEDYKMVKISFRSLGTFPVNELSSKHFNGGGHVNAAGGNSLDSLKESMARFESVDRKSVV